MQREDGVLGDGRLDLCTDQGHVDDPHLWERARAARASTSSASRRDRRSEAVAGRVERDFASGIRAGVTATPALLRVTGDSCVASLQR